MGGITDEDWTAYMRFSDQQRTAPSRVLLTISIESSAPNASQRKRLAQFLKDNPQKLATVQAAAFVMDSRIARASLTAIGWLVNKPFPERVFSKLEDALRWLGTISPACKPGEIMEEIAAHVPLGPVRTP